MHPDAERLVERLGLVEHPEGGWYVETWRAAAAPGARPASTVISFLLCEGERSHWHRVDADEVWCHQRGAPLMLSVSHDGADVVHHRLDSSDTRADGEPGSSELHAVVPAHAWQAAESAGAWTLVTCVVAPGFDFAGFELADVGWAPGRPDPAVP